MEPSDQLLSKAFREGSEKALSEAVHLYGPALYYLCRRFTRNHEDADELVQETFVKAWEKRKKFRGDSTLRTWLTRIALNLSMNFMRKAKSRPQSAEVDGASRPALSESPDGTFEKEDIQRAFEKLPPKQRAVVALRIVEELPYEEIAEILKCSVSAAKSNFHFAMNRMRELLGQK